MVYLVRKFVAVVSL